MVCAWCGKYIGEKDGEAVDGVSHGVCEECLDKVVSENGGEIGEDSKQDKQQNEEIRGRMRCYRR